MLGASLLLFHGCGDISPSENTGNNGGGTVNESPTADIDTSPLSGNAPLTVNFDGSNSDDADGAIVSYAWDFGDGSPVQSGASATTSHQYTAAGSYTAVLTVTDDDGATDDASSSSIAVGNPPPTANGRSVSTTQNISLPITLTGISPTGSVLTFSIVSAPGQGTLGTITSLSATSASITYTPANGYTGADSFTFRVTTNSQNSGPATVSITIGAGTTNQAPTAQITATPLTGNAPLTVNFNGTGSSDSDGTLVSYAWDFGDGSPVQSGASATTSHQYSTAGSYTAVLTVTDDDGATDDASSSSIAVGIPPPTANGRSVSTTLDTALPMILTGISPTGSALTFSIVSAPGQGTLGTITSLSATSASVTYTPANGYTGSDSFTFRVTAAGQDSNTATVTISIGAGSADFEGFGAITRGAEDCPDAGGYATYHVTSLANSGAGTLRDAVSEGCRYVVFDVGGTITLASSLQITDSYITIDGLSAPSPGITIRQPGTSTKTVIISSLSADTHDVIVHHLRNVGDGGHSDSANDIWGLDGDDGEVYNVIIDHITGSAANDGVFDIYGNVRDVTISWNLIKDTETALHLSQEDDVRARISLHHNVFARNSERQIRMRHHNELIDFVNNVIYGWQSAGLDIATNIGVSNDEFPKLNVENNYYFADGADAGDAIVRDIDGQIFFSGNVFPSAEDDDFSTATRWAIPTYAQVTTHAASTLGDTVVPCVGTHYPTTDEADLLDEVGTAIGGAGGSC